MFVSNSVPRNKACQGIACLFFSNSIHQHKAVRVLHICMLAVAFLTKLSRYFMFVSSSIPQNKAVTGVSCLFVGYSISQNKAVQEKRVYCVVLNQASVVCRRRVCLC